MDGSDPPLSPEALKVAQNWQLLTPELQTSVASMILEMIKASLAERRAAPDSRVEDAYGRPGKTPTKSRR
jgi:hypothetical protein